MLAFAVVMAVSKADAATPVEQNNLNAQYRANHPLGKPGDTGQADTRPAQYRIRPDAHKTPEQAGKTQAGKSTVKGAKGHGGNQESDQKGHGAAPVAVIPPVPKPPAEAPPKESGEPPPKLPRFAAFKTDETNMRKGPGQRYPIEWVYKRHDLPVEVEREYDVWRYVRDPDGVEGWVHQVTLSDRRTFLVRDKDATLRSDPKETASAIATLKVGVIGRLRECDQGSQWCQVQAGGYRGYLRRDQMWGLLPDEVVGAS
jgi:SH3-like domain-containing protein